ncbi:MBL fold metallo-hydrolase [Halobacteriovorax sp. RT-2-1]|uniref:MBL fold metallo-hydrolase n=2 Tax=unclassified Halobacteriovorax TaxID=2639665 RepID=UPI00399999BB
MFKHFLLLFILLSFSGCTGMSKVASVFMSSLGAHPNKNELRSFEKSENFDASKQIFINRRPNITKEQPIQKDGFGFSKFIEFLGKGGGRYPEKSLPSIKPDMEKFLEKSDHVKSIWFGHSTILLNVDSKIVLIDPIFSGSSSPVPLFVKRFAPPVLSLEELPEIDYIIISHDHYDHLDMTTMKFFAKKKDVKIITPLGVGSHLKRWGIDDSRITELDWWQDVDFEGIKFTATPAQHFSGRDQAHENTTLWASWVVKTQNNNLYFSGDTGYDIHFKEIGARLGPFDVAFMESGQYNPDWFAVHLLPEEWPKAYADINAKYYFPIHWGAFSLSFHTWDDPILKLDEYAQQGVLKLMAPKLGEIVSFDEQEYVTKKWW